jgi:hypothetical protein
VPDLELVIRPFTEPDKEPDREADKEPKQKKAQTLFGLLDGGWD